MSHERLLDLLWLLLIALTLGGVALGETAEPGLALSAAIAALTAFKGRIVIDHFMELRTANPVLRRLMRGYFYVVPALIVLTQWFGPALARLTSF